MILVIITLSEGGGTRGLEDLGFKGFDRSISFPRLFSVASHGSEFGHALIAARHHLNPPKSWTFRLALRRLWLGKRMPRKHLPPLSDSSGFASHSQGQADFRPTPVEEWLTTEEAAAYLKLHPRTIQAKARRNEIPGAVSLSGSRRQTWRYHKPTLDNWLKSQLDCDHRPCSADKETA